MPFHTRVKRLIILGLVVCAWAAGCRPAPPRRALQKPSITAELDRLKGREIGQASVKSPWIAHVVALDLDRDGLEDLVACEAQESKVLWIRQTSAGVFEEQVLASDMRAPVHAEGADIDGDGDLDVLVSSMGYVFPNNDKIGTVFILENDGAQRFKPRPVLENVARVNDVRAADLNGDGKLDLAVAQFGFDQGEVRWMERIGPWEFRSHLLLELSGAINICAADFTGDGRQDLVVLISQQWEEVYLFENQGGGNSQRR